MLFFVQYTQASETDSSKGLWYGFFNKTELTKDTYWWTETQLRYDFSIKRMQQTLVRTGYLLNINESELGFLYAYINSETSDEHRFTAQHSMKYGNLFNSQFSHRMRLEMRTREDAKAQAERLRYLIRAQQNTNDKNKLVVWNEVFLNLKSESSTGNRLFERNRLFIGQRVRINDRIDLELGYLNQYIPRSNLERIEHILVGYLFF